MVKQIELDAIYVIQHIKITLEHAYFKYNYIARNNINVTEKFIAEVTREK